MKIKENHSFHLLTYFSSFSIPTGFFYLLYINNSIYYLLIYQSVQFIISLFLFILCIHIHLFLSLFQIIILIHSFSFFLLIFNLYPLYSFLFSQISYYFPIIHLLLSSPSFPSYSSKIIILTVLLTSFLSILSSLISYKRGNSRYPRFRNEAVDEEKQGHCAEFPRDPQTCFDYRFLHIAFALYIIRSNLRCSILLQSVQLLVL